MSKNINIYVILKSHSRSYFLLIFPIISTFRENGRKYQHFKKTVENINISSKTTCFQLIVKKLCPTFWGKSRCSEFILSKSFCVYKSIISKKLFFQHFGAKHILFKIILKASFFVHKSVNINISRKRTLFWNYFGTFYHIVFISLIHLSRFLQA